MSRLRRFENLERARPEAPEGTAERPELADRFGTARAHPPSSEPAARDRGVPQRFEGDPDPGSRLRVRDIDEGQSFVRCARCHADGHAASVVCSHCGADLTTGEQRDYNEALWRQQESEKAEQREQIGKMEAAREQAEREAAAARRQLDELIARRRSASGQTFGGAEDTLREGARHLGEVLGGWLRRALPNRAHRIALVSLAGVALATLVAAFPVQAWGALWAVLLAAAAIGWIRRARRFWRE